MTHQSTIDEMKASIADMIKSWKILKRRNKVDPHEDIFLGVVQQDRGWIPCKQEGDV
jgi:hypothetical protein